MFKKYVAIFLLAVSCKGAPIDNDNDQGIINSYIKIVGNGSQPHSDEECFSRPTKVAFKLFTRENPNGQLINLEDPNPFADSSLNVKKQTKVILHGWLQSENHSFNKDFVAAYLRDKSEDVNVISVDFSSISSCQFQFVVQKQPAIAKQLGKLIKTLYNYGAVLAKIHVIGLGMGAQIAGLAGKDIAPKQIGRLTALDPTFLGFQENKPQLHSTDAEFMDVLHTAQRKFGKEQKFGDSIFLANDGTLQKITGEFQNSNYDLSVLSHLASALYYLETIITPDAFNGQKCDSYLKLVTHQCSSEYNYMGENTDNQKFGKYFFAVSSSIPPFGKSASLSYTEPIESPLKLKSIKQATQENLTMAQQQNQNQKQMLQEVSQQLQAFAEKYNEMKFRK